MVLLAIIEFMDLFSHGPDFGMGLTIAFLEVFTAVGLVAVYKMRKG